MEIEVFQKAEDVNRKIERKRQQIELLKKMKVCDDPVKLVRTRTNGPHQECGDDVPLSEEEKGHIVEYLLERFQQDLEKLYTTFKNL